MDVHHDCGVICRKVKYLSSFCDAKTSPAVPGRTQVGLRANPIVGYQGAQLADQRTDQHTAFVQQEIVTGGKLDLNRRVLNEALRAQLFELEAQKLRVSTDIRIRFFEAVASQRRIELIKDFQSITAKGLEFANLRKKASEGSQLEVLQAKVQKNEIDLALQEAEITYAATWRELAAFTGSPSLQMTRLQGTNLFDLWMHWASLESRPGSGSTILIGKPSDSGCEFLFGG